MYPVPRHSGKTVFRVIVGLPPVLSAAAKVERLRKMDALQNPESYADYQNRMRGRMSRSPEDLVQPGHVLGSAADENPERRWQEYRKFKPMTTEEFLER